MKSKRNATSFSKDNQPKKRRGPNKGTLVLKAIERRYGGDKARFFDELLGIGLGDGQDSPNASLLTSLLHRLEPPFKPVAPSVQFELTEGASAVQHSKEVMKAAAQGDISPDVAKVFLDGLAAMLKIEEVTELKDRMEKLEEALKDK